MRDAGTRVAVVAVDEAVKRALVALVVAAVAGAPGAKAAVSERMRLGRSYDGRPIVALRAGNPHGVRMLVFGCIHGTECAGIAVARALERVPTDADLWIVPNLNPDGFARGTRQNGRGVDLNANWSSDWHGRGRPWDVYYPGPRPFTERETRIARNLILRIRPSVTVWFHQHMNLVWAWGPSTRAGSVYARAAGMRFYHHHWLDGTATNWQNHHLRRSASFTVELPAGRLSASEVRRQVRGVLAAAADRRGDPDPPPWASEVDRLLAGLPVSVSIATGGRVVYAHRGRARRAPASNEKLLLSMALLDRFGPRYRIATAVEGRRPRNGVVNGSVWLVGHGDPELNDAALARLAHRLWDVGVRVIRGSVVGVTNTFTRERWARGWHPIALRFVALPTALVYDGNTDSAGFVFDPERRAAAAVTADLGALGIRVDGAARAGRAPTRAEHDLATVRSAPLVEILRRQNVDSLNLDAEVLTKMLGGAVYGQPGSIAKGARAIRAWARAHGASVAAYDGSGLSYADAVSTNAFVRLLTAAARQSWGPSLRATLPSAGEGTLADRLLGLRVRAKTGTLLNQVSALSGWLWLRDVRRWAAFSILSRGLSKARAVAVENEVAATVGSR
jgi:protein MpaA